MNQSELGALKILDRKAWKKKITQAMDAAGGRIPDAAEKLDINQRQLYRWLGEDDMGDIVRVKNGEARGGVRGKYTLTYKGKTQTFREWADETGIPIHLIRRHYHEKWAVKDILTIRDARLDGVQRQA